MLQSEELRESKQNSLNFLDETRLCDETLGDTFPRAGHPSSSTRSFALEDHRVSLIQHLVILLSLNESVSMEHEQCARPYSSN